MEANPPTNFFSTTESRVTPVTLQQFHAALSFYSDNAVRLSVVSNDDKRSDDAVLFFLGSHRHKDNQTAAANAGAVGLLLQLARKDDAADQLAAVASIGSLVCRHKDNQSAVFTLLVQLVQSDDAALQLAAVQVLRSLVVDNRTNQTAACDADALFHVLKLVQSGNAALQTEAVRTFSCLVENYEAAQFLAGSIGAVEVMCEMLKSSIPQVAYEVIRALRELTFLAINARKAVLSGAVEILLLLPRGRCHSGAIRLAYKLQLTPVNLSLRTKEFAALFADKGGFLRYNPHYWFASIGSSASLLHQLANEIMSDST